MLCANSVYTICYHTDGIDQQLIAKCPLLIFRECKVKKMDNLSQNNWLFGHIYRHNLFCYVCKNNCLEL